MSEQETSDVMPEDYVTKAEFKQFAKNIDGKVEDIKDAVNKALEKMEGVKDTAGNNNAAIGLINQGIEDRKEYDDKTSGSNKWLILASMAAIGALSNISNIVKLFR